MTQSVYSAVYSGIPVYEMNCRQVAVMRRREDSYLNATQILKVAGVDKGRRTKILEREVQIGEHEKVQGGYGKYQGTWIPFERGVEIARQYGVEELLRPLFEYVPGPDDDFETPKKKRPAPRPKSQPVDHSYEDDSPRMLGGSRKSMDYQSQQSYGYYPNQQIPPRAPPNNSEKYRALLMSVFLNHEQHKLPEILTNNTPPSDLDIDLIIDDQGHTALHWAAALGRVNIMQMLLKLGADPRRVNFNGESALIRAVLVTNNFDNDCFGDLLTLLNSSIDVTDKKGRSLIHHIALTAGIKGRIHASRYYLETLVEMMQRNQLDVKAIIDIQDKNGDTALNIAARIGNRQLVEQLLKCGADPNLPNKAGLRPIDFGLEDTKLAGLFQGKLNLQKSASPSPQDEKIQDPAELSAFGVERNLTLKRQLHSGEYENVVEDLQAKQTQLQESLTQLQNVSSELAKARRVIQQLSVRLAQAEQKNKTYEAQLGHVSIAEEESDVSKLQAEVSRLKSIVEACNLPSDAVLLESPVEPQHPSIDESKVNQLLSQVLNEPNVQSLVDPLLTAVGSEKQMQQAGFDDKIKMIINDNDMDIESSRV